MAYDIGTGVLFLVLTAFVLVKNGSSEPLYAMKNILVPYNYESGSVMIFNLLLNYAFIFAFVMNVIRNCSAVFSMLVYIQPRCSKRVAFFKSYWKICKDMGLLVLVKFVVDVLLGNSRSLGDVEELLLFYVLHVLTVAIWVVIAFLLYLLGIQEKKTNFILMAVLLVSQYFALSVPLFKVIVIAGKDPLSGVAWTILAKVALLAILFVASYWMFLRHELIGGLKND